MGSESIPYLLDLDEVRYELFIRGIEGRFRPDVMRQALVDIFRESDPERSVRESQLDRLNPDNEFTTISDKTELIEQELKSDKMDEHVRRTSQAKLAVLKDRVRRMLNREIGDGERFVRYGERIERLINECVSVDRYVPNVELEKRFQGLSLGNSLQDQGHMHMGAVGRREQPPSNHVVQDQCDSVSRRQPSRDQGDESSKIDSVSRRQPPRGNLGIPSEVQKRRGSTGNTLEVPIIMVNETRGTFSSTQDLFESTRGTSTNPYFSMDNPGNETWEPSRISPQKGPDDVQETTTSARGFGSYRSVNEPSPRSPFSPQETRTRNEEAPGPNIRPPGNHQNERQASSLLAGPDQVHLRNAANDRSRILTEGEGGMLPSGNNNSLKNGENRSDYHGRRVGITPLGQIITGSHPRTDLNMNPVHRITNYRSYEDLNHREPYPYNRSNSQTRDNHDNVGDCRAGTAPTRRSNYYENRWDQRPQFHGSYEWNYILMNGRQNHELSNASQHFSTKLAPRYVAAKITAQLGNETYQVKDEINGKVHRVHANDLIKE